MNRPHIVVSGGSRGLGLALIESLLDAGYRISTFARSDSAAITELVERHPGALHFSSLDITDSSGFDPFLSAAELKLGPIWGVVNNSAIAVDGVLATLPEIEIQRMLMVNLYGSIVLTRRCLRLMLRRASGGRIVNISSIVGSRGYSGLSVYGATKAALDGFTRGLAREVGSRQITVNSIAPGYMRTAMSAGLGSQGLQQIVRRTPLGRLAEPSDIVGAVEFLLSDRSAFITGQTLVIDGGITT